MRGYIKWQSKVNQKKKKKINEYNSINTDNNIGSNI